MISHLRNTTPVATAPLHVRNSLAFMLKSKTSQPPSAIRPAVAETEPVGLMYGTGRETIGRAECPTLRIVVGVVHGRYTELGA